MELLELIKLFKGTTQVAPIAKGLSSTFKNNMLDCDCVNGDCSTETYES